MLGNAATNIAFPVSIICTATALLLGIGSASNYNLEAGAGKNDRAAEIAGNGLSMLVICGVVIGVVVLVFLNPLLHLFGVTKEILPYAQKYGVHNINLVSPASHDRIKRIAADSDGFLYCVSSNGVTGVRSEFRTDFDEFFGLVRENAECPCCVGFGISSPEQAKKMSAYCDGVIVGSAIVRIMEANGVNSPKPVGEFVKSLKDAME